MSIIANLQTTSNQRINSTLDVVKPKDCIADFPLSADIAELILNARRAASDILQKQDSRLLIIVGPCSVHDPKSALEYAQRLVKLRAQHRVELEIIMRVYFEKPRSTVGWKGLINDPNLDGSFDINKGLTSARELLLNINALGLPAGTEFLDIVTGQYYADLISWGAIGARTTESQIHREMASGLSSPVGFKNGTGGDTGIACDAILSSNAEHRFLSPDLNGQTMIMSTTGNADAHIILRGGKVPNYYEVDIVEVADKLKKSGVSTGIIVDCSHANSNKDYQQQSTVVDNLCRQLEAGSNAIVGCMIESHLHEGKQALANVESLQYGQSITDGCVGWDETATLIEQLSQAVKARRSSKPA